MDIKLDSCRICLEQEGFKNIFEEQGNIFISQKIVYCASVQVSKDDLLPKMICSQCLFYLDIAYIFKRECECTDRKLRNLKNVELAEVDDMEYMSAEHKSDHPLKQNLDQYYLNNTRSTLSNIEVEEAMDRHVIGEKVVVDTVAIISEDTSQECVFSRILSEGINIVPRVYTEHLPINDAERNPELTVLEEKNGSERFIRDLNLKDKVGRHIAKKNTGKLPQRLFQSGITTHDTSRFSENNLNNRLIMNDASLGTKSEEDGIFKFEEILESNMPVVILEETVITDNITYRIETTDIDHKHQENTNNSDCNKQATYISSKKSTHKSVDNKFKVKLKMTLRKGNRKINVFKDNFKDIKAKRKRTVKEKRKNSDEVELAVEKPKNGFRCNVCNKSFPYRSHLKRHLHKHTGEKMYSCEICNQKFVNNYNLNVHMSRHTGEFPLKCEICNKGLPNPSLLKRHMISHTGEMNFQCRYCSVKFRQSSSLKSHEKMHLHRPSYQCDICFKAFSYTNSLTAHKKLHFGTQRFSCDICLSTFSKKSSLVRHMGEHSKFKKIKCKVCDLSFQTKSSYNSHSKTHCKYKCETCGEGFRYRSSFIEHIKYHKQNN